MKTRVANSAKEAVRNSQRLILARVDENPKLKYSPPNHGVDSKSLTPGQLNKIKTNVEKEQPKK